MHCFIDICYSCNCRCCDVQKYTLADTTGFPETKDTLDYEDAGNVVVPLTLQSNVKILHQYLFGEDGYTPSSTLSAISSEIESISAAGGSGSSSDSYDNGYDNGSYDYNQEYDYNQTYDNSGVNYDDSTTYDPNQGYDSSQDDSGNYGYDSGQSDNYDNGGY